MPTPAFAALAPIIGSVVSAGAGIASSLLNKPKGPPELDEGRKKTLGSFAERLAQEAGQQKPANTFNLGPGSTPIRFSPLKRNFDQPMTFQ